jgi:post-segregation antitoxin (ccd killing protein)
MDEIAMMPDDELNRRISSLSGYIERERRRGNRQADLEVEHSYLAREAEIRVLRKAAHEKWMRENAHRFSYHNGEDFYA